MAPVDECESFTGEATVKSAVNYRVCRIGMGEGRSLLSALDA
jgi:hypothetical protein